MKENQGQIVEFQNKDGNTLRGIARYSDQREEFQKAKKVFVRLTEANGDFKKDKDGKSIIALKSITDLKLIGFVD